MNVLSIDVAVKGIRETVRDRRQLLFLIGFPIVLICLFNFGYSGGSFSSGGGAPHEVAIINNDMGIHLTANGTTKYVNYGSNFAQVLESATAENSTKLLFHLNNVGEDKANDLLNSRDIDALIIIPKNFSSGFATMVNNSVRTAITSSVGQQTIANSSSLASSVAGSNRGVGSAGGILPGASVTLPESGNTSSALFIRGDSSYMNYATTSALVTTIFDSYKSSVQANATARAVPGTGNSLYEDYIPVESLPIAGTQSFTSFDYVVPGLIIFAVLLQVTLVAGGLAEDVETGILERLKLSEARGVDLLTGMLLRWTLVIAGQMVLLTVVAIALGFHYQGDFSSLGLAVLIGVIAGMAAVALALIIASFTKNFMQAATLGGLLSVPLAFLSGAMQPLPRQVLGEFGGQTYQVYDLLPWTHAVSAIRSVLTFGSGLSPYVIFQMMWLIVLAAIWFVVGVVMYSRTQLRAEK
jgi:ABC-2 type transport system permease protein